MNSLNIHIPRKYKLFKWLFGANRTIIKRKAPANWDEISKRQYKKLIALFFFTECDEATRKVKTSMILYRLNPFHLFLFEPDQMHVLVKKCEWIFTDPITHNFNPVIKAGFQKLYGPGDNLRGYTGEEFQIADTYFMRFNEDNEEKYLNKMLAVLYRPKAVKNDLGDVREKFVSYKAVEREKQIAKLSPIIKYGIYLFYKGCRTTWEELHPELFGQSEESNEAGAMWHTVLLRISGKEFGNYDTTVSQPIHNLFTLMNQDIIDYNKQKSKNRP